ncbi:MAG: ferritin-like domain-containing protein [Acidobacteria bacterium]|nr:ferritin-like domain-containing protein [Acidobacteriota bacterium]
MRTDGTDVVEDLNRLMAEEAEACLRYFQMRFRLRGKGRAAAEKFFDEALKETLEHADAIARQIRSLGHVPTLRINLSLSGGPMRPEDALAEALEVEQQALDAYEEFLPRVSGHGALEDFIRRQIAVETEHVQEILEVVREAAPLKLVAKPTT